MEGAFYEVQAFVNGLLDQILELREDMKNMNSKMQHIEEQFTRLEKTVFYVRSMVYNQEQRYRDLFDYAPGAVGAIESQKDFEERMKDQSS